MAGTTNATSVIWNPGDSTGRKPGGGTASIPGPKVQTGSGVPSSAPTGGTPFYVNTANNKLYAWNGTGWVAISGANT